jgi:hypothetical protein
VLLEQGAALTFCHAAPDAELDAVVQGVGTAFHHHRAVPADDGGFALSSPPDEQLVGIGRPTQRSGYPGDTGFPVDHLDRTLQ